MEYEGIFVSNGPGDPTMCAATIEMLKWAMTLTPPKPIFGICLGNQLLALAAGAKTYKMKYGNRGMNQPCVDMRTTKCYITAQNHGCVRGSGAGFVSRELGEGVWVVQQALGVGGGGGCSKQQALLFVFFLRCCH